ncbi:metallophosphoesterase [Amaricoccus sp.]|uniref:metallophosphoesterase n=1 Tax=Amaricoccus sp. TaxID=1872485 RepID=UPI001B46AD1C|nr:metallophosphoesterase [Amaricoccus sp.]MBP7003803.1 serine/threonine protein phosphatase [Amaricoccus sp.]
MTDLTEGQRVYAIGDVHGRRDLIEDMLDRVRADLARRPHPRPRLVTLGDYIDRGPESRGVIETLMGLRGGPLPVDFLLGNHDSYIETYLADPEWQDRTYHWLHPAMGGAATLASYGVTDAHHDRPHATRAAFAAAMPEEHRAFLRGCALWLRIGGYVLVHAGIRPGVPLEAQARDDCIWIREPFLGSDDDFGFTVVHGHTIVDAVERRPNRIAIDTGVARGGPLTCLVLEGPAVATLAPDGPVPLPDPAGERSLLQRGLDALRGR